MIERRGTSWNWVPPVTLAVLGLGFALLPLMQGRAFLYWDNEQQHLPQTVFLQEGLRQGIVPQWWPDAGLGFPATAEGQAAHYHPIRLLTAWLFSAPAALMWEMALYFTIAGLGTYFFLRQFRLQRLACVLGGISQMFSGFAVVYVRNIALHRSFCLLPVAMWCAERFVRTRSLRSVIAAAVVVAIQLLAGHPSFAIVTMVATSVYVTLRLVQEHWSRRVGWWSGARHLLMRLSVWALGGILAFALAGVQSVPTLLHVGQSQRQGGFTLGGATQLSASPRGLGQLLFPYAWEQGDWLEVPAAWGYFNPTPNAGMYCGMACVLLAPVAFWWRRRWPWPAWPLAASAAIAVAFALGARTPLFPLLLNVPGLSGLRFPSRFLLWAAFAVSCLAALGAHKLIAVALLRRPWVRAPTPLGAVTVAMGTAAIGVSLLVPAGRRGVLLSLAWFVTGLLILWYVVRGSRRVRTAGLVLISAFVLADLWFFRAYSGYARTIPVAEAVSIPAQVEVLKSDSGVFRVLSLITTEDGAFTSADLRDFVQADLCTIWDVDSADVYLSLFLKRYYAVRRSLVRELLDRPQSAMSLASFLGAMNVKYLVSPAATELPGFRQVHASAHTAVWENPSVLPRAFLVGRVAPQQLDARAAGSTRFEQRLADYRESVRDWSTRRVDAAVIDHVMSRGLDYATTAEVAGGEAIQVDGIDGNASVETIAADPDEMRFVVTTATPAFLVISSSAYPGWSATVNGRPARLYETNWIMLGLEVPPGTSDVVLSYSTPGFKAGAIVSLSALALVALLFFSPVTLRRASDGVPRRHRST
jgi:hypothetical protein